MSYNDKILLARKSGLFKPTIVRTGNNFEFADSLQDFKSLKDFSNTNIESTSSFRYGSKKGIVSTQEAIIDYSKFENHTFFHSAVAKTNEAFDAIINKFPFDGDGQEIESFQDDLTGFEKYVYDSFPKNIGYLNFTGSNTTANYNHPYISLSDGTGLNYPTISRNKKGSYVLDPKLDPFTFEMHLKVPDIKNGHQIIFQKYTDNSNHITLALSASTVAASNTDNCHLIFGIASGSANKNLVVSGTLTKGKFHHIAAIYDKEKVKLYIDVDNVYTSSKTIEFKSLHYPTKNLTIGTGSQVRLDGNLFPSLRDTGEYLQALTASIDEFRYFKSERSPEDLKKYRYKNLDFNTLSEDNKEDKLTLYYKFNEPAGSFAGNSIVFDHSGNSLHSQITNFTTLCRNTGSDVPVLSEKLSINPILFPGYSKTITLNSNLMTTASFYDDANPNLITKLIPPHYFAEGNEEEGFSDILGEFKNNFSGGSLPNQTKFKSAQLLTVFLLIWAKFFDEIKIYIDTVSDLKNLSYDNYNIAPDNLLKEVGRLHGINLPPLFKGSNVNQLFDGINIFENSSQSQLSLLKIQNTVWRRILATLPFLKRKKGTLESVKSIFRSSGIEPDNIFTIREYGGNIYNKIDNTKENKIDVIKLLNFSGSNAIVSSSLDEQGRPNNKPTIKSGFLSGSRTQHGLPKLPSGTQATASIQCESANAFNYNADTIKITDSNLKAITYRFRNTAAPTEDTGTIELDDGNIIVVNVNLFGKSNVTDIAEQLKLAIESENGHNGTIKVVNSSGTLALTQNLNPFKTSDGNISIVETVAAGSSVLTISGFSNGVGMSKTGNSFYHGISSFESNGLFTTGSFTYEGQYLFDQNSKYPVTQSLVRLHTTGAIATGSGGYGDTNPSGRGWEGVIANLIYNSSENILTLHFHDSPTEEKSTLKIHSASLFNNELWNISFGYNNEISLKNSGSLFLRLGRQESGKIYDLNITSSFVTASEDSVLRNITGNYNASGSFITIGSQSISTAVSSFLNKDTKTIKNGNGTNFEGFVTNIKFFSKFNDEEEFKSHVRNPLSHGTKKPKQNYLFENNATGSFRKLRILTDAKQHTTASDASGNFRFFDFTQNDLHLEGKGFEENKLVFSPHQIDFTKLSSNFDISIADSKIRIRSLSDRERQKENFYAEDLPVYEVLNSEATIDDPRFSIDMSTMKGLNEQIMKIFSDYDFFNDALGKTNLFFGEEYPDLIALRRIYFKNVLSKLDLGKYSELFKWIDNSLTNLIFDMIPYTTKFMGINFVYENHVLDRNKFKYKFDQIYNMGNNIMSNTNAMTPTQLPESQNSNELPTFRGVYGASADNQTEPEAMENSYSKPDNSSQEKRTLQYEPEKNRQGDKRKNIKPINKEKTDRRRARHVETHIINIHGS
jgi:hypothetical protein